MGTLQSFKIKSTCKNSDIFYQLPDVVGSGSHDKLTDMKPLSPNAIRHLAQPHFATIFCHLVTLKVDMRGVRTKVNVLTSLEQLETLEAQYCLHLPTYAIETDLTVHEDQAGLRAVDGWSYLSGYERNASSFGRASRRTLRHAGGVGLPVCTQFTYDDCTIGVLPNFRIPKLGTLTVRNEASNKMRSSMQLATIWSVVADHPASLKPRTLQLDTQCYDQHLINALGMLPELEELFLGVARPDGPGKKFFEALRAEEFALPFGDLCARTASQPQNLRYPIPSLDS
jgi:hypothetical protein